MRIQSDQGDHTRTIVNEKEENKMYQNRIYKIVSDYDNRDIITFLRSISDNLRTIE